MPLVMECPGCGRSIEWSTGNPHRPFCSARCKDADFIGWVEEKNVIPVDSADVDFPDDTRD
jgi:uncharacterized protein